MIQKQTSTALIPVRDGELTRTTDSVAGQLAPKSQRIYASDIAAFLEWLDGQGIDWREVIRDHIVDYRAHLQATYAKRTAMRKLVVVRRLFDEAVQRGIIAVNPAATVRGFRTSSSEASPHIALTKKQAKQLLEAIDRMTPIGKRDYALLSLLLRTGLRRAEAAALELADLRLEAGHHVADVRHGKGDKRRLVKLPKDVQKAIDEYRLALGSDDPWLFVAMYKSGESRHKALGDAFIERIVAKYGEKIGVKLTPHDLRATFITLALEGGAPLHDVQYAVGHADPRTTEHYQKRKIHLDNNAVDFVRL